MSFEAILSALPLFRTLTPDELQELARSLQPLRCPPQSAVFNEGDAGDGLYLLLTGKVEIRKADAAGQSQLLAVLEAPAVLGEMSLLARDSKRSATAWAQEPLTVAKLSNASFDAMLKANSLAAFKLVHVLAQVVCKRLSQVDEKLVEVLGSPRRQEELAQFQQILKRWAF